MKLLALYLKFRPFDTTWDFIGLLGSKQQYSVNKVEIHAFYADNLYNGVGNRLKSTQDSDRSA